MTPIAPILPAAGESEALIALARHGDTEAFCELCGLHEAAVRRQAMALCGDVAAAEELAQDTFVAAWKSLGRFNARCAFLTWLCAILIHLYKGRMRQNRCASRRLASLDGEGGIDVLNSLADDAATPVEALVSSERAAFLRHCLNQLPDKQREVMFLRFYSQESLQGIAAVLNCSIGTVKSRLFHALEKLRNMKKLAADSRSRNSHL